MKYTAPEMNVVMFETEEVIVASATETEVATTTRLTAPNSNQQF